MHRRVVVTGMGSVNALANTAQETWESVLKKKVGVTNITRFDVSSYSSRVCAEVKNFDEENYCPDRGIVAKIKRLDTYIPYMVSSSLEAVRNSGIDLSDEETRERVGVSLGSGVGGIASSHENTITMEKKGHRRISPFYISSVIDNTGAGIVSMLLDVRGPNLSVQTACATSNHNIATAFMLVRDGYALGMVAGGANSQIFSMSLAGFSNIKALSTKYNDTPEVASRPFDINRDGFVFGEGAGVVFLEEYEHAKKRGADIICEVISFGMTGDAYDIVAPHPEGRGAMASMKMALETGGLNVDDIGYVNLHGTSTPIGDTIEANTVAKLFFSSENYYAGSVKSMFGHTLGAASGIEAIVCAHVVKDGKIPANVNLFERDPGIYLNRLNTEVIEKPVKYALSNSFGFGGHNCTVCFGRI